MVKCFWATMNAFYLLCIIKAINGDILSKGCWPAVYMNHLQVCVVVVYLCMCV